MSAPRKYPDELRQRAVRLVRDAGAEPGTSRKEACRRVGRQLGISPETLRGWVNRAEIDDGDKPGIPGRPAGPSAVALPVRLTSHPLSPGSGMSRPTNGTEVGHAHDAHRPAQRRQGK